MCPDVSTLLCHIQKACMLTKFGNTLTFRWKQYYFVWVLLFSNYDEWMNTSPDCHKLLSISNTCTCLSTSGCYGKWHGQCKMLLSTIFMVKILLNITWITCKMHRHILHITSYNLLQHYKYMYYSKWWQLFCWLIILCQCIWYGN